MNMRKEFEDAKGVIGIHKSKDRQHNVQPKRTDSNLQNTAQKTKD
jgi:hypothetical protein